MATPGKGKRAIVKDRTVGETEVPPISICIDFPSWRENQRPREDSFESLGEVPSQLPFSAIWQQCADCLVDTF